MSNRYEIIDEHSSIRIRPGGGKGPLILFSERALGSTQKIIGALRQLMADNAALKDAQLRQPTLRECEDIAEWHKSNCEAYAIDPSERGAYGRAMYDAVRLVLVDGPSIALQQSSSGITAGAEKPSQVVDFGAAGPIRTGDLLITNQNEKAPETSQNQDVTPKTAPAQPAHATPTESIGCEGVTAGQWSPDVLNGVANALALAAWLPANQDKKGSELQSAAFTLFGRALVAAARSFWHGSGEPIAWLRDPPASGCEGVTAGSGIDPGVRDMTVLTEFAWLVERADGAYLFANDGGWLDWTRDHMRALRFVRRIDADAMAGVCESEDCAAVQHGWHTEIKP